jgi:hypothetical protein
VSVSDRGGSGCDRRRGTVGDRQGTGGGSQSRRFKSEELLLRFGCGCASGKVRLLRLRTDGGGGGGDSGGGVGDATLCSVEEEDIMMSSLLGSLVRKLEQEYCGMRAHRLQNSSSVSTAWPSGSIKTCK